MTNYLGKFLVLINLALAVVFFTWAGVLFVRPVDMGWKEPRKVWGNSPEGKKEPNERIASQIDERMAGYKKLREMRTAAVKNAEDAEAGLKQLEGRFGSNRVFYNREVARLEQGPGQFAIKEARYNKDGTLAVQPGGAPVLDQLVPDADRSYNTYLDELFKKAKELEDVSAQIAKVHEAQKKLTVRLNGIRGKDGKVAEPGYYDLLEAESEAQKKLKEEVEYLQPLWVMELYNAQLLRARRLGLEKRLVELGGDPSKVLLK